ncbi:MAG: hypothetical protein HZT40_14950 [Candidatus Thiothrix singaporensis]|uniref:histidine kinase n=1 Tax=Candidatus Thiothrix singaporensis TaxID=2799669 RepID=A0A7L6AU98_9GAMM|nr:MAG: hypothetical protein HZT40_14950 [Candidatus Thiothrix singaporensis]
MHGEPYDIEHRIVAHGEVKWVREKAYLELDDNGVLLGGFGITQDITKRKLAELALLEANHRKDEFLAMLAHELRNPLAPISNAVQILRITQQGNPAVEQTTNMVGRQVRHLVGWWTTCWMCRGSPVARSSCKKSGSTWRRLSVRPLKPAAR